MNEEREARLRRKEGKKGSRRPQCILSKIGEKVATIWAAYLEKSTMGETEDVKNKSKQLSPSGDRSLFPFSAKDSSYRSEED